MVVQDFPEGGEGMMQQWQIHRGIQLAREAIKNLNLDLAGITVLTEVGSGQYLFTPLIAALAGAKATYAYTRDSRYGKAVDTINSCKELIEATGNTLKIEFCINQQYIDAIGNADIITNSGFLRPLNQTLLKHAKKTVVIPLMYEAWELRENDVDIDFCKKENIKVAGTWENHPAIKVFENVKMLALKMAYEAGYEVFQNKIIVWSDDHFGENVKSSFLMAGAYEVHVTTDFQFLLRNLKAVDFIFICDYDEQKDYFEGKSIMNLPDMMKINSNFGIVHLYGKINNNLVRGNNINIYPDQPGNSSVMTYTLGHVGLKPIIDLQAAGFKVGEEMIQNKLSRLTQPITF